MTDFETVYGYPIQAYQCDCHPDHRIEFYKGTWSLWRWGIASSALDHAATVEAIKTHHRNVRPVIPSGIQALLDQITHWELRTRRAEEASRVVKS